MGGACSLGDLQASLVPNPSFEDRLKCPDQMAQLDPIDGQSVGTKLRRAPRTTLSVLRVLVGTTGTTKRFERPLNLLMAMRLSAPKWVVGNEDDAVCLPEMELYDVCEMKKTQPDNPAPMGPYYEYIGTCLTSPLRAGPAIP